MTPEMMCAIRAVLDVIVLIALAIVFGPMTLRLLGLHKERGQLDDQIKKSLRESLELAHSRRGEEKKLAQEQLESAAHQLGAAEEALAETIDELGGAKKIAAGMVMASYFAVGFSGHQLRELVADEQAILEGLKTSLTEELSTPLLRIVNGKTKNERMAMAISAAERIVTDFATSTSRALGVAKAARSLCALTTSMVPASIPESATLSDEMTNREFVPKLIERMRVDGMAVTGAGEHQSDFLGPPKGTD